ncbi:unnamed protein product [Phytophthora fragariaefolia]|uniref:Unnamed protein product n=1 Tax=Phytophthora fragariaefolia TaxID=1490495 RepID=A0A9W6TQ44_9STRA|nr:unnamed protein product [Phytophthora fragariaefolia]
MDVSEIFQSLRKSAVVASSSTREPSEAGDHMILVGGYGWSISSAETTSVWLAVGWKICEHGKAHQLPTLDGAQSACPSTSILLAYSPGMNVDAAMRSELTSGRQQSPYRRWRVGYVMNGRSHSTIFWGCFLHLMTTVSEIGGGHFMDHFMGRAMQIVPFAQKCVDQVEVVTARSIARAMARPRKPRQQRPECEATRLPYLIDAALGLRRSLQHAEPGTWTPAAIVNAEDRQLSEQQRSDQGKWQRAAIQDKRRNGKKGRKHVPRLLPGERRGFRQNDKDSGHAPEGYVPTLPALDERVLILYHSSLKRAWKQQQQQLEIDELTSSLAHYGHEAIYAATQIQKIFRGVAARTDGTTELPESRLGIEANAAVISCGSNTFKPWTRELQISSGTFGAVACGEL